MNTFDNIIFNKLAESVVNIARDDLDETVFQVRDSGIPILRDAIKIQILGDIDQIRKVGAVENFFVIGSILTKNYTDNCDIDVSVQIDPQLVDSICIADMMHLLKQLNGRLATGTTHPINYYIITHPFDEDKSEAVYDPVNEKWIKAPKKYDPEVEKWAVKFQDTLRSIDIATGELRRDLIDLEEIKNLDTKDIKNLRVLIKQKLSQIEELATQLIDTYHDAKKLRHLAFDRFLTPQEIQLYGSQNRLPENILYKLLEKYYYIKFIKKIESILDEKDALDLSGAARVNKVMGDLWKVS